ncbi:vicilin-like seed storage protein At2g18540 [Drosophila ficusphila]|uniref:vicilin-like seed storage protein At2g18540 n=1 Tax=Drosophila ficusphila TaxID=30025 RepID=UPI001C8954A1|nr:vicilin-like seed storage protein At2g18540 [Drosophila ficusphila]
MSKILFRPLTQPLILRRLSDKKKPKSKPSNTPRPPKDPPDEGYNPKSVDHDGLDVPAFVSPSSFRQFSSPDEKLGPGAGKALCYKNAQYFGYHRFSFMELVSTATELRDERRLDGGLQASIEPDEKTAPEEAQLETMKKLEEECDAILGAQAKQIEEAKSSEKEKNIKDMSEDELKEWCNKKEEDIKKKEQQKNLEDMSDEELSALCQEEEAAIKAKEEKRKKEKDEAMKKKCEEEELKKMIEKEKEEFKKKCEEQEQKKKCEREAEKEKCQKAREKDARSNEEKSVLRVFSEIKQKCMDVLEKKECEDKQNKEADEKAKCDSDKKDDK